jgi:hypothetical protein
MRRLKKVWGLHALISVTLIGFSQSVVLPNANSAPREVTITLGADDNISGVAMMQIAENKDTPPAAVAFSRTTVLMTEANILWVRVQDRALNWSTWVEVQVGGAPVIRDPLAKTVYVPVPLVPYVPPPSTTTVAPQPVAPQPVAQPASGGGAISAPIAAAPPVAITEVETVTAKLELAKAETLTAAVPAASPSAVLPPLSPSLVDKSPAASQSTQPLNQTSQKSPSPAPSPTPAGIKAVSSQTKPAVALNVATTSQPKVVLGINKVLEVKMPIAVGVSSVKAAVTDASGKNLALAATVDKKTGKVTIPKLAFSKPGTYQITMLVGKKTTKVTVLVR